MLEGKEPQSKTKSTVILLVGFILSAFLFFQTTFWGWTILIIAIVLFFVSLPTENIVLKEKKEKLFEKFYMHKSKLESPDKYFISSNNDSGVIIDIENQSICLMNSDLTSGRTYNANDIIEVEIIENGNSISKTSRSSQAGGVLIGGLLAGGVGAVIGGLSGKNIQKDTVTLIDLKIIVNDLKHPVVNINFFNSLKNKEGILKSSELYKKVNKQVNEFHGLISVLIKNADQADTHKTPPQVSIPILMAGELEKLFVLQKEGVITKEEFEIQKKKIMIN
ncbi:SHOCT domain-containing protein [Paenibacillus sp. FSL H8-0332]|uniref:SHOCT domain-containing protein n=1 Tax=Paenibacillus sp. FSL H8-0332 TaxID=2954742 RepID=UPI0030D5CB3F